MTIKENCVIEYNKYVRENQSSIGKDILQFADAWARKMEEKILLGEKIEDMADKAEKELYKENPNLDITGSMYSVAVCILCKWWKFGEELETWHNKKHGYTGNGVVNSSVITITL